MGINTVIDKWVEDQRAKRSPLKDITDIANNVSRETEKVNNKKIKTTLSSSTSSKINELTLELVKAKETEAMDDAACDTAVQQLIDSVSKVVEKKTTKQEVVVVESIDDKINRFKNTPEYAEFNKALNGRGEDVIDVVKLLATSFDNNKEKLEGLLGASFTSFFDADPIIVPFDEDKKPKNQKDTKKQKKDEKIIDVDEASVKEVKEKKPQDAMKLFQTKEEAVAELKKEEEKEKLERVDTLPPVTVNKIQVPENSVSEITNESVKNYLTDLFTKVLKDTSFEIFQHKNGLYILRVSGLDTWFDNNQVIKRGVNLIVDTYKVGPDGQVRKFVEFLPVKNHADVVLAWATNANNIRQTGIQDPTLLQLLEVERNMPMEVIRAVDFSTVTREAANSDEFIRNIYQVLMCPQMRAVPPVRYKVKAYKSPNKFVLTSNSEVRSQMMEFGLTCDRYADNLTIAFDNKNNIKVMYAGKKMQFALDNK